MISAEGRLTWIIDTVCARELCESCWRSSAGANNVHMSTVDVPLGIVERGRGHPRLDAHQILARGGGVWNREVELAIVFVSIQTPRNVAPRPSQSLKPHGWE